MKLIVKGNPATPDQEFDIPDPTPPTDLTAVNAAIAALDARVKKLEGGAAPAVRRLFLPTSFRNAKLADDAKLHANSAGLVKELARQSKPQNDNTKPAFNSLSPVYDTPTYDPAIPYFPNVNTYDYTVAVLTVKDPNIPKVKVRIVQNGQDLSSTQLYKRLIQGVRIPAGAKAGAGTDKGLTIWDQVEDTLTELWRAEPQADGSWIAAWGGQITDVSNSNGIFPMLSNPGGGKEGWGSAATGLSLRGGIITLEDLRSGVIAHGIGVAIPEGPDAFVWPANRTDHGLKFYPGPNAIAAGTRFRFPKDVVIDPNWVPIVKMMVAAIRDYGFVVQDRSGAVSFYAEDTSPYSGVDAQGKKRNLVVEEFFGGKQAWDFMGKQFPFSKLQALDPSVGQ